MPFEEHQFESNLCFIFSWIYQFTIIILLIGILSKFKFKIKINKSKNKLNIKCFSTEVLEEDAMVMVVDSKCIWEMQTITISNWGIKDMWTWGINLKQIIQKKRLAHFCCMSIGIM